MEQCCNKSWRATGQGSTDLDPPFLTNRRASPVCDQKPVCVSPWPAKARQGPSLQTPPPSTGVCSDLTVLYQLKSSQTALGVLHGEKSPKCSWLEPRGTPRHPEHGELLGHPLAGRGASSCPGSLSAWLRKLPLLPLFTPPHQFLFFSLLGLNKPRGVSSMTNSIMTAISPASRAAQEGAKHH